jgi:hypothetical protein
METKEAGNSRDYALTTEMTPYRFRYRVAGQRDKALDRVAVAIGMGTANRNELGMTKQSPIRMSGNH